MQRETLQVIALDFLLPFPTQRPSEWCVQNVEFDEASNHGPFRLDGCEYIADVVDDWARPEVTDVVLVFGSQTRKTGSLMGGACWAICNDPSGFLWVMPSLTLARKFTTQRFKRMLHKSAPTARLIPSGARRHEVSALSMMLGPSTLNFVGSNSAANLSSNPCRRVVLDEVDKFDVGGREEADAVNLAEQRTKDQVNPQRWKTSTPTLVSGLIWQEFLKGDRRRYYVPCPHCSRLVVFAWSKRFTVLPLDGREAFIRWPADAKRSDGTWDMERVLRETFAECPHCQGKIKDEHKKAMVKKGEWQATNPTAAKGFVSRHLPSLYVTSPETTFGSLAVKFLQNKASLLGLQGFINGDLAEPYQSQDLSQERTELVRSTQVEITAEWRKLLTADVQAKWPYIWFTVRAWNGGDSEGVECGHVDTFDELRALQLSHQVTDAGVVVDSGFGSKTDAEVYRHCANNCKSIPRGGDLPLLIGWMPSKGMPSRKRWTDPATRHPVPYYIRGIDPFLGTTSGGKCELNLFEFASMYYEDILATLRDSKRGHGYKWGVSAQMDKAAFQDGSTYWKHMDGHIIKRIVNRITGREFDQWCKRHTDWPDHLLDCEILQVAVAHFFQFFVLDQPKEKK